MWLMSLVVGMVVSLSAVALVISVITAVVSERSAYPEWVIMMV